MHARVDKLGTLGQGIDEHEMRPAGIFDKGLLTEVFKQERLAQKADAEWQRELRTVVQHADVISRLEKDGTDAVGSTPQAFAALLRQEHTKWSAVIRQTGIRVE
ncbi:MAG: hypothetical protein V4637_09280 [Pseudomonadota bacterium]